MQSIQNLYLIKKLHLVQVRPHKKVNKNKIDYTNQLNRLEKKIKLQLPHHDLLGKKTAFVMPIGIK